MHRGPVAVCYGLWNLDFQNRSMSKSTRLVLCHVTLLLRGCWVDSNAQLGSNVQVDSNAQVCSNVQVCSNYQVDSNDQVCSVQ